MNTPKCCVSREAFLTEKLLNFKRFVEPYCLTDEMKEALETYSSLDSAMPLLLQAVAISATGTLDPCVNAFCDKFPEASKDEAFRTKVARYIHMFVEVLTS